MGLEFLVSLNVHSRRWILGFRVRSGPGPDISRNSTGGARDPAASELPRWSHSVAWFQGPAFFDRAHINSVGFGVLVFSGFVVRWSPVVFDRFLWSVFLWRRCAPK